MRNLLVAIIKKVVIKAHRAWQFWTPVWQVVLWFYKMHDAAQSQLLAVIKISYKLFKEIAGV